MAKGRIVGALSFETLQAAFVAFLSDCRHGSSRLVWVLVPTNTVALHLRRVVAAGAGGVMGVEFMTLEDAAMAATATSLARRGQRPIPEGARELVLAQALKDLPKGSYMSEFSEFPGSVGALGDTLARLRHALWTPEHLEAAAKRLGDRVACRRLAEVASLWRAYERFKENRGSFDKEDVLLAAARDEPQPPAGGPDVLMVYGFYDLTALQRELIGRLAARAQEGGAYLLWDELGGAARPGFEYAEPTVAFLKELFGGGQVTCLGQHGGETNLATLRRDMFAALRTRTREGQEPSCDGSVTVLNCPGEVAEGEEIAREVLRRFTADEAVSVGLLARAAEDVAEDVCEALDRAGVKYYLREGRPLAGTIPGRLLLGLLELAASDARRGDVVAFLSVAKVDWPGDLSATALDRLSRQAGIVKGWQSWIERLGQRAESLARAAGRAEVEMDAEAMRRDAGLACAACEFLKKFSRDVQGLQVLSSWAETARKLDSLLECFTPEGEEGAEEVSALVRGLAALDVTGVPPDFARVWWLVRRGLRGTARTARKFGETHVSFCSIMRSRAVSYDVVVVPRLVEKSFPRQIKADPLLSDADRRRLNALAAEFGCGALPLASTRPAEERYLLRIALGSARRAIVLSYPRIEQDTGRPRVVSRFVQQACEAVCGGAADPQSPEGGRTGGLVRRVRLSEMPHSAEALDKLEYDFVVHCAAADGDEARQYTCAVSGWFGRAVEMDSGRWRRAAFGPYDGKIRDPELLEALRERYDPLRSAVSASSLEDYATCPFSYLMKHVLGVEEEEEPTEAVEVLPSERGRFVHALFAAVYRAKLAGRPLGELTDADVRDALAFASREADRVRADLAAGPAVAWQAARRQALAELRQVLEVERAEDGDAAPREFELAFGPPDGGGEFALEIAKGRALRLRGRIDRVDDLADGGVQVVDYKTGTSKHPKKNSFAGGQQLQLPLYLLAAAAASGKAGGRARYLLTAGPKFVDEFALEELRARHKDLCRILSLIIRGITEGDFFPVSAERCYGQYAGHCPFKDVCGPGRAKLMEMKRGAGERRDLRHLEELWTIT